MTRPPELFPADMIRDLVDGHTTHEQGNYLHPIRVPIPTVGHPRNGWTRILVPAHGNHIKHPGLLDQLEQTVTGRTLADDPHGGGIARSKPAGRIDVLAYLARLERESRILAAELDVPALPLRQRLTKIGAKLSTQRNARVYSWWVTARVLTQHDTAPYSPAVPCPNEECEQIGTVRVRLDQRIASCTECHDTWTDSEGRFQSLASWCAWAAEHLKGPRHWVTDVDGFPVECTACLATRQEMTKRQVARIGAKKQAERDALSRPRRHAARAS